LLSRQHCASSRLISYWTASVLIFSEHMDAADGERMFRHACALGLEGIVSKRLDKPYSSGRCHHWRKVKNPSY
jgi:bifunctional non-homologous end joining protein LigD